MSIRILATAVLRYKKHFWPKSIPLLISFLLRQIRLIMLHVWSQHLLKTWTRQCLHFSFDNSISLSQSRFVSIQDASDTLWMLCNECVSKQIYSWKVREEKKMFLFRSKISRVYSRNHRTGKSSFVKMLILFYVFI